MHSVSIPMEVQSDCKWHEYGLGYWINRFGLELVVSDPSMVSLHGNALWWLILKVRNIRQTMKLFVHIDAYIYIYIYISSPVYRQPWLVSLLSPFSASRHR